MLQDHRRTAKLRVVPGHDLVEDVVTAFAGCLTYDTRFFQQICNDSDILALSDSGTAQSEPTVLDVSSGQLSIFGEVSSNELSET